MLFSRDVFNAFDASHRDLWVEETAHTIRDCFADYFDRLDTSTQELEQICAGVQTWAKSNQIIGGRDVAKLCVVAVSLGHKFWQDPRFSGYISASVGNSSVERSRCSRLLTKDAENWLTLLWNQDAISRFAKRLEIALNQGADNSDATLRYLVPNHWSMFNEAQNSQYLAWLRRQLPQTDCSAKDTFLSAGALIFGSNWWDDPQYAKLITSLMSKPFCEQQQVALVTTLEEMN